MSKTSLLEAASIGDVSRIKELLAQGENVNQCDALGETALHRATVNNHTICIRLLCGAKIDINARNKRGEAALHEAASSEHSNRSIAVLIDLGAAINDLDGQGESALHIAARNNQAKTVSDLLVLGANAKNKKQGRKNSARYCKNQRQPCRVEGNTRLLRSTKLPAKDQRRF